MNVNQIDPALKLYTLAKNLEQIPAVENRNAINMISMINETTKPKLFKAQWKINPSYKLTVRGPLGPGCRGGTGLHAAVRNNNLEMMKFFIENLDIKDLEPINENYSTPLISAVFDRCMISSKRNNQNLDIIRQLLVAGANPNIVSDYLRYDGFHASLLSEALKSSDFLLTKLLLQFGAQKLYAFSPDRKSLIKQKFTEKEEELYKRAKQELKNEQIKLIANKMFLFKQHFLTQFKDENATLNELPHEIFPQIFTPTIWDVSGRAISSNQSRIDEAKRLIEENKKREAMKEENINGGNALTITNY